MDMLNFIQSRRSTRKYKDTPVEQEKLLQVLEAGRYAPSGGNCQTCRFLAIRDRAVLDKLARMTEAEFAAMEETPGMYPSLANSIRFSKKGGYLFHYGAPVLIVVANKLDYGNNIADTACALENMMLMANALDLGSCWINQLRWLNEAPALLDYLRGLGLKEDERVYGALALGYADTESGLPERTPAKRFGNEVVFIG